MCLVFFLNYIALNYVSMYEVRFQGFKVRIIKLKPEC